MSKKEIPVKQFVRRPVESMDEPKIRDTEPTQEARQSYTVTMPKSRHQRIKGIMEKIPGCRSINQYINQAIEKRLLEDEAIADSLSKEIQTARKNRE